MSAEPSNRPSLTSASRIRTGRRVRSFGSASTSRERVRRRLEDLYRVGRHIALFGGDERAMVAVLGLIAETLPLRSAMFMTGGTAAPQLTSWLASGEARDSLDAGRQRACRAFADLIGDGPPPVDHLAPQPLPSVRDLTGSGAMTAFLTVPLAAASGVASGVLQLEVLPPLDESDLAFVYACGCQLASAFARERPANEVGASSAQRLAWLARHDRLEPVDHEGALRRLVHMVGHVAVVCAVDVLENDGRTSRIVSAIPSAPSRERLDAILDSVARLDDGTTPRLFVDEAHHALLSPAERETARELGLHSWLRAPLEVDGHRLGVLTLLGGYGDAPFDERLLGSVAALSERAAIAEDNSRLHRAALAAIQYRDELLTLVSHDLKNPLGAILITADALLASGATVVPRQLELIRRAARRMVHLIGDLLDVASIEARHLAVQLAPHRLAPLLQDAVDALRPIASDKGITLEVDCPPELPLVSVDRLRLHQILSNLLGNALKFTGRHGCISLRAEQQGEHVRLLVTDTGSGIAPEDLPHVFERFWQAPETARHGTGLGLYIVRSLVEAQGGTISVRSGLGVGTTFAFTVRVSHPER
ncbi:MAG: hypothetical protein NVS3B10_06140 [Polyangiales bacterium]